MCQTPVPTKIYRGEGVWEEIKIPCRDCKQCKWQRVNDYVGRGLCEADQADHTFSVTLTYRDRDDMWAQILNPSHFQNFIRSLRDRNYYVRYIASGEYGEKKGRAHFHACLFFYGAAPEWEHWQRNWDESWPHGHMFVDTGIDDVKIRYALKYLQKDRNSWFTLSKKPILGWPFFEQKALSLYEHGLMPVSRKYRPVAGVQGFSYSLQRTAWRDYLLLLNDLYEEGGKQMPALNEHVEKALDAALRWRLSKTEVRRTQAELFTDMLRGIRDGKASEPLRVTIQRRSH